MLEKQARLSAKEVVHIQKTGKKRSTKHFFMSYLEDVEKTAFGVAAPKGGEITGVLRNRLRRRVYAFLKKEALPSFMRKTQGMIGARKGAYQLTNGEIQQELASLFNGIIK